MVVGGQIPMHYCNCFNLLSSIRRTRIRVCASMEEIYIQALYDIRHNALVLWLNSIALSNEYNVTVDAAIRCHRNCIRWLSMQLWIIKNVYIHIMLCIRNHIYFIIYNTIFYVYIESAWLKLSILCVSFGAGTSLIHSYASHAIKLNMNSSHTLTYTHTLHTQTYDSSEIGMKHNNFASSFFCVAFSYSRWSLRTYETLDASIPFSIFFFIRWIHIECHIIKSYKYIREMRLYAQIQLNNIGSQMQFCHSIARDIAEWTVN